MTLHTRADADMNLASLADHVVVGIGLMLRKRKKSRDVIDQGIGLCDRLLAIGAQSEQAESVPDDLRGRRKLHSMDVSAGTPTSVSAEEIRQALEELRRLGDEGAEISDSELRTVQHLFVQATTMDWLQCASDFQQRRLKRGLKPSL